MLCRVLGKNESMFFGKKGLASSREKRSGWLWQALYLPVKKGGKPGAMIEC